MKRYNILHVSPTPLVDAPRKVSDALRMFTEYESSILIFNDYPGRLKGVFSNQSIIFDNNKELAIQLIQQADVIHIHNFLSKEQEKIIIENSSSEVCFVYQVHSPLREGPNFTYYESALINFDIKCVISQYHSRLYPDFEIVPNIVLQKPTVNLIGKNETPRVLFSPAHNRVGGRWNDKYSSELMDVLSFLNKSGKINLVVSEGAVAPYELHLIRMRSHITIDEIVTGAFHQVSLEGLCAGNVVVNNADCFSCNLFESFIEADDFLPFFKVSNFNVYDRFVSLVENKSLIAEYQNKSYNFFNRYLMPGHMIMHFKKLYDKVIDNDF
ncbi:MULTISPECIES: hypothetical protein [unclassified Francisella]|uniref:hypothetical protein n=1 Tax=unclassified Francisella TaxID=2610885 RepID=UPI002E30EB19|nr:MULTISPECIES: hypothetical protein [unclassified Francisella]MED7820127.1 hypothetical protein [Francisella sp. 19S2-4]MED7830942.1 hypothetical protein [Francisella sp. 19S2-10]